MDNETKPKDKIYWHGIFYEAIELEFTDYASQLHIESEHLLSKQALQIDVLVIKKDKALKIEKKIGRIFKGHNILEYKSTTDNLTGNDYQKVVAYGLLYASFQNVDIDDITLTMVIPHISPIFRKYLLEKRGFELISVHDAITHINGDTFTIQIIEQSKLSSTESLFLSNIKKNIPKEDIYNILKNLSKQGRLDRKSRVIQMIIQNSFNNLQEVLDMESELTLDEAYRKLFKDSPLLAKDLENAKHSAMLDVAKTMLSEGESIEKIVYYTRLSPDMIKNL